MKCNLCRRKVTFLAVDMIPVLGEFFPLHRAPFPCSKCETREHVVTSCRTPQKEEYGRLVIRRPARVVQTWTNGLLGD